MWLSGTKESICLDNTLPFIETLLDSFVLISFKIELITSNNKLDPYGGETTFNVKMNWDYESGNDALDTKWGTDAYNYKQNHPDEPGLKIIIELKITQSLS
mgnify:CR=1 FL=1